MKNRKHSLFFWGCVLALVPAAYSQSATPMKTKALSFEINGLYLSGLNGGVGGKMWLPGNRVLVGSLDARSITQTREDDDTATFDEKSWDRSLTVNVGIEQHYDWAPGLSPYLMGGVSLGYSAYRSKSGYVVNGGYQSDSWRIYPGAKAGFGLEYWLTPRVSLAGQQVFSGSYGFGRQTDTSPPSSVTKSDVRSFTLDLGTSSLMLSVYL